MKYCRFLLANRVHYSAVEERRGELWITSPAPAPVEDVGFRLAVQQAAAEGFDFEPMPLRNANLLAPVTPSKIICVWPLAAGDQVEISIAGPGAGLGTLAHSVEADTD